MNIKLEMKDLETGDLLAHRCCEYECNFDCKDDRGFKTLLAWCRSCVRGIRVKHFSAIQLRIEFLASTDCTDLFCDMTREEFNEKANAFLV